MGNKQDALEQIVTLARAHGLTGEDVVQALAAPAATQEAKSNLLSRVFAHLGGIFVFAGIAVYIGMFWEDMNSAMRVLITFGVGIGIFVMALVATKEPRYERAVTPLFLISALLQPGGMFVAIHEWFNYGGDPHKAGLLVFGVMLIQQLVTFQYVKRTVLLFTSIFFGAAFFATLLDLADIPWRYSALVMGLSLLCISYHLDKTPHRAITGFWYFFGSIGFLYGAFHVLRHSGIELLYLGLTVLLMYLSALVRSRILLLNGTIATLVYIGYYTSQHFVDSLGWPISLILFGLILLGVSSAAVKIKKKYM